MKKYMFVLMASAAVATPAMAQDAEWNGPYAGVHIGYGTGTSDTQATLSGNWSIETQALQDHVTGGLSPQVKPEGLNYGVQLGYNAQLGESFVLGVEGDFSLLDVDDSLSTGPSAPASIPWLNYTFGNDIEAKHMYSLRAKAGVAIGKTLIYATGGWAWVKSEYGSEIVSSGGYTKEGRIETTTDGFIIGGGIEQKLGSNVSARLDYSYTEQGDVAYSSAYRTGSTYVSPAYNEGFVQNLDLHLIRLGVNFHF